MSASMPVLEFFEDFYRPAKHPGDPLSRTCQEFRSQLRNLSRPRQFSQWIAWKELLCEPDDRPALYRHFEIELDTRFRRWKVSQIASLSKIQLRLKFEAELTFGKDPAWWAKIADFSDGLIIGAMSFLVEVGRKRTTANKVRSHCNSVWRFAKRKGFIATLPENEKYRCDEREPVALWPDQVDLILAAAARLEGMVGGVPAALWWTGFILLMLELGVRISAAMGIPTTNLAYDRCELLVPCEVQKQRKDQWLDLFPDTMAIIQAWRLEERGITTVLGDWPYGVDVLRRHYKRLLVDAGMYESTDQVPDNLLFHCLRKTLGSMIYEKHGIEAARERLNHSEAKVTWRYIGKQYRHDPKVRELITPFTRPALPTDEPPPAGATPPNESGPLRIYRGEAG